MIICLGFVSSLAYADPLPNFELTPGVARTDLTVDQICSIKWGKDHRAVTEAMKKQVFKAYKLTGNDDPFCKPNGCEIDHLISRELGGADDVKNLWPQSYSGAWNAHLKDRVENRLHVELCAKHITLDQAQSEIRTDWTKIYIQYFGQPE